MKDDPIDTGSSATSPARAVAFTGSDASAVKESASATRAQLARAVADLEQQQVQIRDDIERRRNELEAEMAAERARLDVQMRPLREQLRKMQEVMWTVDLYLGRDESLRLLRDGAPAPADTPITIRQRVLVMAEESLILMDRSATGMTADNIPEFVEWLLADKSHLERVLPAQRGVAVLIATRVESKSGNIFEDSARDAANQASWWLLRNGERIYLLTVDPELRVADRMLPRRSEFVDVFDKRMFGFGRPLGAPVEPGSQEWLDMEKVADARRRHYMRIMLVLQGIIDRTPVWHPLPEFGVNLLSLADQDAGKIVLWQDDEESIQITDGREDFRSWQARLNKMLRPGLRVIGDWDTSGFSELAQSESGAFRHSHPRLYPPSVNSRPAKNVPHLIEGRRDGGFVIRYQRADTVWRRDVPVPDKPGYVYRGLSDAPPRQRASCIVMASDSWVLPFDLVSVADLEYYLASRDNRSKHFLSMVPTIKAALAAKADEASTEAPFRELIGQELIAAGADPDTIAKLVDELVHWWKIAHTWARPLNGEPAHEARAIRDILAEHHARTEHAADVAAAETSIAAGKQVPGALAVARNRQGRWHVYAATAGAHDRGVFLDVTPIRRDGSLGTTKAWQTLTHRSAGLLHAAWATDEWANWTFGANPHWYLTGPERNALVREALAETDGLAVCVTEFHNPREPAERTLAVYSWTAKSSPEDEPVLVTSSPFGYRENVVSGRAWKVIKNKDGARLVPIDISDTDGHTAWFGRFLSDSPLGQIPWWPDDARRYPDIRPRLVWSDSEALGRLAAYRERCQAAVTAQRQVRAEFERRVNSYVEPIMETIRDTQREAAKARFVEDFGPDAMDLWPAHLGSLRLADPLHQTDLWALIAISLTHGHPVDGVALAALADVARHHGNQAPGEWHPRLTRGRVDVGEYGHITVPPHDDGTTPLNDRKESR